MFPARLPSRSTAAFLYTPLFFLFNRTFIRNISHIYPIFIVLPVCYDIPEVRNDEKQTLDTEFYPADRCQRTGRRRRHRRRLCHVVFGVRRDRQHPGLGAGAGDGADPGLSAAPVHCPVDGPDAPQALPGRRRHAQRRHVSAAGGVSSAGHVLLCGLPGLFPGAGVPQSL